MKVNIGNTVKRLREEKNMSLRNLASAASISTTSLSNIEKNKNSPTYESLVKICDALGVHLVDFLISGESDENFIVRKEERKSLDISDSDRISYELISSPQSDFKVLSISMEPGCDFGYTSQNFPSNEICVVTKGRMEIVLDGKPLFLEEGDSIYIKAGSEYKYRNTGDKKCICLWSIQGR